MSTVATRLYEAMRDSGIDQSALARAIGVSQGTISLILRGKTSRSRFLPEIADKVGVPLSWLKGETDEREIAVNLQPLRHEPDEPQRFVMVDLLPTFAGAGGGGSGEGEAEQVAFPRSLIETEFRAQPSDMLAVPVLGDSMEPDFRNGDQLLIDKRFRSINQPGAFCLWDGDGYVIKLLEKVYDSEPAKIRVISRNATYSTAERLVEEVSIMGRVVWFGRRV